MKRFLIYALIFITLSFCFWQASCEAPAKQPCEPLTIYVLPNYDSALAHYAPYSNLINDTAIYRNQVREKEAINEALMIENGKLRMRLGKAATDIAALNSQLRHCIFVSDTTKIIK